MIIKLLNYKNFIFAFIVLFLVGCLGVTKTFPEKKYYLIEAEKINSESQAPKGSAFKIRRFSISQKFEGKEFVYRQDNVNFESDFYNSFFISPTSNLREEMTKGLLGAKLFEWDANQNTRIDPSHFFEVTISELYGDFQNSPKACMSIDVFVYMETGLNTNTILKKSYHQTIDIQKKDAGNLVVGWNQGLTNILKELEIDLKGKILIK
ncbi:MAG: hypothetical protein SH817_16240 [Leptospira sp.]|nr:hypothetical protein [Leptospira sp.]